ncbi:ornithine cyclodeaminase family protein [Bordetella trematum]|uniref:ornithine cyclodeaminase family protein n=1 Tax=Bordetella trematum TaxID=123899 RepID=UPI000D837DBE|nr:ornithine cyclodeaminase family protein [Bordetella trematum]SPU49814.1 ornithine cyclodeaminase [Bordetella trematum]VDH07562.1 ornithine cyclodeaminase [Bordetella trematum]
MKFIDTENTRRALAFERLIPALKEMFVAGCEVPLRHTHTLHPPGAPSPRTVLIMPAWQPDRYLGIKTVNIFPENGQRGLPGLYSTYLLYDGASGEPLAQIDGNEITSRRTAAASALAASYLAPEAASRLLVLGCGRVGSLIPEAYRVVRPIEYVSVWDRNPQAAHAMAERVRRQGMRAEVVGDLARAAGQADIVSCATLASSPVLQGAWLAPHAHLDLIGSFTPQMREADDACFAGARLYVDTQEALQKSGELLGPMSRGIFRAEDVAGDLAGLASGRVGGRQPGEGRTVFKAVGTALEDLASAILVYEG